MLSIGTLKMAIFVSLERDFSVLSDELGLIKFYRICFKYL